MRKSGHWGPFSGGQLTTMFVALILVVGFPFAAGAVTGSNVFVTDATSGAHVAVSATGAMKRRGRGDRHQRVTEEPLPERWIPRN